MTLRSDRDLDNLSAVEKMARKSVAVFTVLIILVAVAVPANRSRYFPVGVFSENAADDRAWATSYSRQLRALDEPSLLDQAQSRTPGIAIYRFLWVRSFLPVVSVRLRVMGDGSGMLLLKQAPYGSVRGEVPRVDFCRKVKLTKQQMSGFQEQVEKARFWSLPTRQIPDERGPDGAEWMIEGVIGPQYHVMLRWSPKNGPIQTLGLSFIRLAGLKLQENEIY